MLADVLSVNTSVQKDRERMLTFLSRQNSSTERGGGHERNWQLIPSWRGRVSFKRVVCGGLTTLQGGSHIQEYLGSRWVKTKNTVESLGKRRFGGEWSKELNTINIHRMQF